MAEDALKTQSLSTQQWHCGFAMQSLLATNLRLDEIRPVLKKSHFFIKESQVKQNTSGDFNSMYRHISKDSWTFSDQDHCKQVSDCTAEGVNVYRKYCGHPRYVQYSGSAIQSLVLFKKMYRGHTKKNSETFVTNHTKYLAHPQYQDGGRNWILLHSLFIIPILFLC